MKLHHAMLAACLAAGPVSHALAQGDWPSRPLSIVVAFPPGSPGDTASRIVSQKLTEALGQSVIVENRPGAGGNLGADYVAKAKPDGYTFLQGPDTVVTINPSIYTRLGFSADDLIPVATLARFNQMLVCAPQAGFRTLGDLAAGAKHAPGRLDYASGGAGVPGHLAMELYLSSQGLRMQHVPYRGPSPATQDVLAGHVACGYLASPVVAPHVQAGKLHGLAVSGTSRSVMAPDVPTMAEAGVQGYDATFREVLLAPAGTPSAIVERMNTEINRILQMPDVRAQLEANDLVPAGDTPQAMAQLLAEETRKWAEVVRAIDLKVD